MLNDRFFRSASGDAMVLAIGAAICEGKKKKDAFAGYSSGLVRVNQSGTGDKKSHHGL
jgi:hypothetical protein